MDISTIAYTVSVWAIPVLLAVTLHEAAHGWAAWRLGDDTAYRLGRVTFNPFRHIDPFGTLLLPIMLLLASGGRMMFGFAKPVPVNFRGLRRPRRDMVLVAIAGPAINLALAVVAAALFHTVPLVSGALREWYGLSLQAAVWVNLLLAVFNMLPLPPLDGGRVAVGLLPWRLAVRLARLERAGIPIILAVVFIVPWIGDAVGMDLNVFWWLVGMPTSFLEGAIFRLVGLQ
ncbi:site-2 protease family protein [Shumkonia mesophila]|uniref:site-2 protease family protein n=1 Tax=Shumkonia mesophila TaxID=2838854 RepID=UPI0029345FE3|nr:site-2 protease family protein [Shumkonia mesophila]